MDIVLQSVLMWTGFGLLHSILAERSVKQITRLSPQTYRIFYNTIFGVLFLVITLFMPSITSVLLEIVQVQGLNLVLFVIGIVIGSIITLGGLFQWDLGAFAGVSKEKYKINTSGFYAFSRHPVYSGIMIIFFSLFLIEVSPTTIAWVAGICGYFIIGSYPEEQKLGNLLDGYGEYRSKVGRFFPYRKNHFKYLLNFALN